jgi:hypothetical protein
MATGTSRTLEQTTGREAYGRAPYSAPCSRWTSGWRTRAIEQSSFTGGGGYTKERRSWSN